MFRKGGSASDGVGITSGLSSRQNYQVGRLAIDENYPYTMDDEGEDENISVNLSSNNLIGDDSKLKRSLRKTIWSKFRKTNDAKL